MLSRRRKNQNPQKKRLQIDSPPSSRNPSSQKPSSHNPLSQKPASQNLILQASAHNKINIHRSIPFQKFPKYNKISTDPRCGDRQPKPKKTMLLKLQVSDPWFPPRRESNSNRFLSSVLFICIDLSNVTRVYAGNKERDESSYWSRHQGRGIPKGLRPGGNEEVK